MTYYRAADVARLSRELGVSRARVRVALRAKGLRRLYEVDGYAGCVERRKRANGAVVSVLNAEQADLCEGDGETAWYTHCDAHEEAVGHSSLALAKRHAVVPEEWCSGCMERE